jgi:hypothetical protein
MSKSSKPIPVAIPNDLLAEIERVSDLTQISKQDIMRLAMRIGLADMDALGADIAKVIQQAAEDKGTSFSAWAKAQNTPIPTTVKPSTSGFAYRKSHPLNSELNDPT